MPDYLFKAKDGDELSEFFHVDDRPSIGDRIRRGGKTYTRVAGRTQAKVQKDINFIAWSQEKHKPGAQHYSDLGFPAFSSRAKAEDFAARHNMKYGGDG